MADGTVVSYCPLIDLTQTVLGYEWKYTVTRAGETPFDVDVTAMESHSSKYVHHAYFYTITSLATSYTPWSSYKRVAGSVDTAMTAEASAASWTKPDFSLSFNQTTGKYSISNQTAGAGLFDITFANTASANFFGFSGTDNSGASSYVGTYVADYCIIPSIDARSNFSREYEPGNISSLAVSDSGRVKKGIVRADVPMYIDWQQAYEPKGTVFTADATATTYFTWEKFWKHCRQSFPFLVHTDGSLFEMHMLRDTSSNFRPEPMEVDNHEYFHLNFETHFMGRDPG